MTDADTATLKALASAVTGEETPAAAKVVSKPTTSLVWALALAGPAISLMLIGVIAILAGWLLPVAWPAAAAIARVHGLSIIGGVLAGILGLVVFRLASGGLKRIEAKAGPGSVLLETGDE